MHACMFACTERALLLLLARINHHLHACNRRSLELPAHLSPLEREPWQILPLTHLVYLCAQAVFETMGCNSLLTVPAPVLALRQHAAEHPHHPPNQAMCGLVVDAGFSFTHVVPIFDGQVSVCVCGGGRRGADGHGV